MKGKNVLMVLVLACAVMLGGSRAEARPVTADEPVATVLVTGMASGSGSTIGPGGALYVTEGAAGRVLRVDPKTGDVSVYASGLPNSIIHIGGAMDIAFMGSTAYVLVTVVGAELGGDPDDIVGIYRVDGPDAFTVIADLGTYSMNNLPGYPVDLQTGVQYALETYRGGFLVTDGHHNRVLSVTLDGEISEVIRFGNNVPTGLAIHGNTVYMGEAGAVPHLPEDGRIISFETGSPDITVVAAGAPLLVDVKFGRGRDLFGLAQGIYGGGGAGAPAQPNTGSLVRANSSGTFDLVADELNQPTSLEIIGDTAYVVTLGGEIWQIDGISGPPYGR